MPSVNNQSPQCIEGAGGVATKAWMTRRKVTQMNQRSRWSAKRKKESKANSEEQQKGHSVGAVRLATETMQNDEGAVRLATKAMQKDEGAVRLATEAMQKDVRCKDSTKEVAAARIATKVMGAVRIATKASTSTRYSDSSCLDITLPLLLVLMIILKLIPPLTLLLIRRSWIVWLA